MTVIFAALTWIGANIVIPIQPVPITLQTLFVLLAGAIAGRSAGITSQALYVLAGGLGLPIFASGALGWAVLAGPTGGYLVSFIVVPFLVAALINRHSSLLWHTGVFTLASLVIFALGLAHLTLFHTHSLATSVSVGMLPFLPGAVFKVIAAVSVYRSYQKLTRRG